MAEPGYLLTEAAVRKLVDDHRRLSHEVYQLKQRLASTNEAPAWPRELFWGKTLTEAAGHPDDGNTFKVKLIDRTFDESVGDQAVTDTVGGSAVEVEARTVDGCYVPPETVVQVEKRLSRKGWRYWILPGPTLYHARAKAVFCQGTTSVECDQLEPYGWCDDSYVYDPDTIVEAVPRYGLEGCLNEKVLLARLPNSSTKKWAIVQVTHKKESLATDMYYENCAFKFKRKSVAIVSCCPGVTIDTIQMYLHTYYSHLEIDKELIESMDPANSTCDFRLRGKAVSFCAFDPVYEGDLTTLSSMRAANVHLQLDTEFDDGICVKKHRQWVYVIGCVIDADDAADVFCTTECDTGSGS